MRYGPPAVAGLGFFVKRHADLLEFHITLNIVPGRITRCFIVWFDHIIFRSARESIDMDSRNVSGSQDAHEQTRYPLLSHMPEIMLLPPCSPPSFVAGRGDTEKESLRLRKGESGMSERKAWRSP